jgi:hypothetical protein
MEGKMKKIVTLLLVLSMILSTGVESYADSNEIMIKDVINVDNQQTDVVIKGATYLKPVDGKDITITELDRVIEGKTLKQFIDSDFSKHVVINLQDLNSKVVDSLKSTLENGKYVIIKSNKLLKSDVLRIFNADGDYKTIQEFDEQTVYRKNLAGLERSAVLLYLDGCQLNTIGLNTVDYQNDTLNYDSYLKLFDKISSKIAEVPSVSTRSGSFDFGNFAYDNDIHTYVDVYQSINAYLAQGAPTSSGQYFSGSKYYVEANPKSGSGLSNTRLKLQESDSNYYITDYEPTDENYKASLSIGYPWGGYLNIDFNTRTDIRNVSGGIGNDSVTVDFVPQDVFRLDGYTTDEFPTEVFFEGYKQGTSSDDELFFLGDYIVVCGPYIGNGDYMRVSVSGSVIVYDQF